MTLGGVVTLDDKLMYRIARNMLLKAGAVMDEIEAGYERLLHMAFASPEIITFFVDEGLHYLPAPNKYTGNLHLCIFARMWETTGREVYTRNRKFTKARYDPIASLTQDIRPPEVKVLEMIRREELWANLPAYNREKPIQLDISTIPEDIAYYGMGHVLPNQPKAHAA